MPKPHYILTGRVFPLVRDFDGWDSYLYPVGAGYRDRRHCRCGLRDGLGHRNGLRANEGLSRMSLDRAIKSGKEHRKPYRKSKAFDPSCRNHGGCGWCEGNRAHNHEKKLNAAIEEMDEYGTGNWDTTIND